MLKFKRQTRALDVDEKATLDSLSAEVLAAIDEAGGLDSGLYNVVTYGAAGTGSGDDSTAIQEAIDDCIAAGGGTVYFPTGIYRISTGLAVAGNDVTLRFDGAGIITNADITMLRIGEADGAVSPLTYQRCRIEGDLNIIGSGNGNTSNVGLVVRNHSYLDAETVKIYNCGGGGILVEAQGRGCQYNKFGVAEITSNFNGDYVVLRSSDAGGYVNDNAFHSLRVHDNETGSLTSMRLVSEAGSDGVNENAFYRISVESSSATDTLLSLEGTATSTTNRNLFYGLRLDGVSGTNTLVIDEYSRGTSVFGVTFDGDEPDDSSDSTILVGARGSETYPYLRMGDGSLGGLNGWEIGVQKPGTDPELHVAAQGASVRGVRFPLGTKTLFGDRDGGDNAPFEVDLDNDLVSLRTLGSVAIGSGPILKFEGEFSSTPNSGNVTLRQVAPDTASVGKLGVTGDLSVSGKVNGRNMTTDGSKLDGIDTGAQVNPDGHFCQWGKPTGATASLIIGYANVDITITKIVVSMVGTSTPGFTWDLKYGTSRNGAGTSVVGGGTVAVSLSTPQISTSFTNDSVPATSLIWADISGVTGTVDAVEIQVFYTYN